MVLAQFLNTQENKVLQSSVEDPDLELFKLVGTAMN
jgi:hypothetical protein